MTGDRRECEHCHRLVPCILHDHSPHKSIQQPELTNTTVTDGCDRTLGVLSSAELAIPGITKASW